MGFALIAARADHHDASWLHRFDPVHWTVNFPRPMLAAVVATAPDALRVDLAFVRRQDLAGLIWDSVDRFSHPLLSYATGRDYRRCRLAFRWRSAGVVPLDAVYGPTLTIEGRDAAGSPRTWYVRLWNYAVGTGDDALVSLDFGALDGGFLLPAEADPVFAGDIDRMFIAMVPPGYDGSSALLPAVVEAWVELTGITASGSGAVLGRGDAMLPGHDLGLATSYDDAAHLTPQRLVRQLVHLGYGGDVIHYVGMSHYPRLAPAADGSDGVQAVVGAGVTGAINGPCAAWHRAYAGALAAADLGIIWSLSYELFDAYCPEPWKQRDAAGNPALTGWVPPSTLLSPASAAAMAYLQAVAAAFVTIGSEAGLAAKFQVGEPWWWVNGGGQLCAFDAATTAALGAASVTIADVRGPLGAAQTAMLDALGGLLAASTAALVSAARAAAAPAALASHILIFLPTVLDAAAPDLRRCNVPLGWAAPAFDVCQLEDYDWITAGRAAETGPATALMAARLGYPVTAQDYLAGFVLNAADRGQWRAIVAAARAAQRRGVARSYVWALPQVTRDGLVIFGNGGFASGGEDDMQPFDDVDFPLAIGRDAAVITEFSTQIVTAPSGHEQRSSEWADARMRFDAGPGLRSLADLALLAAFFRARRGAARGFRFADPLDATSAQGGGPPAAGDQYLGQGDGVRRDFPLVKHYGAPGSGGGQGTHAAQRRRITHPRPASVVAAVAGVAVAASGFTVLPGGTILFAVAPPAGAAVTAGFAFDVPVRFADDRLDISRATFMAGAAPTVPLIEVRVEPQP